MPADPGGQILLQLAATLGTVENKAFRRKCTGKLTLRAAPGPKDRFAAHSPRYEAEPLGSPMPLSMHGVLAMILEDIADLCLRMDDHRGSRAVTASEREKMESGQWYCCLDPELDELRLRAREAVHEHNTLQPRLRGAISPALRRLLADTAEGVMIEAPFHCAYGINIALRAGVYLNAGCSILDTASVRIGEGTMMGPQVQIYCAEHHQDPVKRKRGMEIAKPVDIGNDVWIGGAAVILGGVTIGDNAIVGAGAVVTRDVAASTTVIGSPARSWPRP